MRTALVLAGALVLANAGWAAETDLENPSYRELPLQRGPISGGKQRQPTQAEIDQRAQERGRSAEEQKRASDALYQRVLKQSQQGTPRSIDPSK
ncbi:MAG: hypothetical protein HY060_20845 [Proteobacteria bacterium]|nr:hypothetical protein [Pseudomonadota bacterium]